VIYTSTDSVGREKNTPPIPRRLANSTAECTGQKLTSKVFNIESPPENWLACERVEVFVDGRQLKKATDLQVFHDVHLTVRKMHARIRDITEIMKICKLAF